MPDLCHHLFRPRIISTLVLALLLAGCSTAWRPSPLQNEAKIATSDSGELRIAASALSSGDLNMALSLYERLTQRYPESAEVWLGMANTRFLQGELAAANSAYVTTQRLAPNNIDAQLGQARILIRQRQLPQAITRFKAILVQFPNHPLALCGLGVSYDLSGDYRQAQSIYRQGLLRYPDDVALRSNLGLSLALNGQPREAVNTLLGTTGLSEQLPQERDNLALAYGLLGRDDAAEEILEGNQPQDRVQDNLTFYRYLRQNMDANHATNNTH